MESTDRLWAVLLQYGIDGQLPTGIKSLHMHFEVNVELWQCCSVSPILFLIYMKGVVGSKMRLVVNISDCTVQRLLFADELVQLDSTQNGLQQALDRFLDVCSTQWRNKGWGGGGRAS